jgi:chemotaxis regulatin CheY-phosphate phosphatase CheZ
MLALYELDEALDNVESALFQVVDAAEDASRIADSIGGEVKRTVHKDVNNMKGSLSDEELREMCRRILDYSPLLAELSEGRAA